MVQIIDDTTKNPLQKMGSVAGICWNSPVNDPEKNKKRGISCIRSGHTRVAEWVNIEFIIDGYSARCIRELARHIVGTSFLQSSTRYVDAKNMDVEKEFFYPPKLTEEGKELYKGVLAQIMDGYRQLEELGLPKEDAANLLPLGMHSKIVWKMNLRAFMHLANLRLCTRAYHEIRKLVNEMKSQLSSYSDEWAYVCDHYIVPKCELTGFCDEDNSCGRRPKNDAPSMLHVALNKNGILKPVIDLESGETHTLAFKGIAHNLKDLDSLTFNLLKGECILYNGESVSGKSINIEGNIDSNDWIIRTDTNKLEIVKNA